MICNNKDGIVLLHSQGKVSNNQIQQNERCGITLWSETKATVEENKIMYNKIGIDIKDQAEPIMERNEIVNNVF